MRFATKGVNCTGKKKCQRIVPLLNCSSKNLSYVEAGQIGTHVCANFLVVDLVSSPLGVSAHGTGAVALVEVLAGLLGVERQAADGAEERGGGLHGGGGVRSVEAVPVLLFQCRRRRLTAAAVAGITAAFGSVDLLECSRVARVR